MRRSRTALGTLGLGLVLAVFLGAGPLTAASSTDRSAARFGALAEVRRSHERYAVGDWKGMALAIREAYEKGAGELERANLLELLAQARRSGIDSIPVDWKLPEEVLKLRFTVNRRVGESTGYSLRIGGETAKPGELKQIRVTRFPDEVILDFEGKIGESGEEPDEEGNSHFWGHSGETPEEIPGGLYLLRIEMASGASADGWVLVDSKLNMSSSPRMTEPYHGQVFHNANPELRWDDFRSAEYQPEERRSNGITVVRSEAPDYDWKEVWSNWFDTPATETRVGEGGHGVSKLVPGRYVVSLTYHERSLFGPVRLVRSTTVTRPFFVK